MRVDLVCPYADKDAAKRLGARWDPDKRVWYVIDPPDLLVFSRWLRAYPALDQSPPAPKSKGCKRKEKKAKRPKSRPIIDGNVYAVTGGPVGAGCGCNVPPWEDCEHTEALANSEMLDQLSMLE